MKAILTIIILSSFIALESGYCQGNKSNQSKISQISHSPNRVKFDPSRDAEKDIKDAIAAAGKSGKNILLDVGGEWCIWCHRLDKLFEDNKDLSDFEHENFIVVKVNYSNENKNEKVLSKYPKVSGYPHLFVLDKDGNLLHSQNTGDLESEKGQGHDKDKVFAFLREWSPKKKS